MLQGTDARQLFSDAAVQQQVVVFLINHSDRLFPGSTVQCESVSYCVELSDFVCVYVCVCVLRLVLVVH